MCVYSVVYVLKAMEAVLLLISDECLHFYVESEKILDEVVASIT